MIGPFRVAYFGVLAFWHLFVVDDLEAQVRVAVLGFVQAGRAFTPHQIASVIEPSLGAVPIDRVARLVRRLFEQGLLRPFRYRRAMAKERTRQGVVTAVLYAPPPVRSPRLGIGPSTVATDRTLEVPARQDVGSRPTAVPAGRPFAYLGLSAEEARRLERQTEAIRRQIALAGRELLRAGELLLAVRALVGASGVLAYAVRELGMSRDTARRWMRVARVLGRHPELARLWLVRPAVLYKVTERGFPGDLREVIIKRGLVVKGEQKPIEALSLGDVLKALEGWRR